MSQSSAPEFELLRPTIEDVDSSPLKQLAETHWLDKKANEPSLDSKLISGIYDDLKQHDYPGFSLWILEYLHYLENYLWPLFNESSSDTHVISIALMVSTKVQERLPMWDTFTSQGNEKFSHLFRRMLSLCTTPQISLAERRHVLMFITGAFQSLDSPIVRKQCAPLVSISIWNCLHEDVVRDTLLKTDPALEKVWRKSCKRFDAANLKQQGILKFERTWIFSVVSELCQLLTGSTSSESQQIVLYAEVVLQLLICLVSQLPTRRFTNALLKDIAVVVFVKKSSYFIEEHNILLRQLLEQFEYFMYFPVDDFTGLSLNQSQVTNRHYKLLAHLQSVALKEFPEKLKPLALSNYAAVGNRADLMDALDALEDSQVEQFCNALNLPTDFSNIKYRPTRSFLYELLCDRYVFRRSLINICSNLDTLPQTQSLLFNSILQQTADYDGRRPLAIPRIDLQYLTIEDFLVRAFQLSRLEAFFQIKNDIRDVVRRLKPSQSNNANSNVEFLGSSKMAVPIPPISILEIAPIPVGGSMPAYVRIEALLDLRRASNRVLSEWESLRPKDVVFLLQVRDPLSNRSPPSAEGIVSIISGEVVQVLDEVGRPLHQALQAASKNDYEKLRMGRQRRLEINIDARSYDQSGNPDQYNHFNLLVRRRQRENNFKPILDNIKDLSLTDVQLPDWLIDLFLGFGDPSAASYLNKSNRLEKLELFDTLIDWHHLEASFPYAEIQVDPSDATRPLVPPFVIEDERDLDSETTTVPPPAKKSKSSTGRIIVSSSPLAEQGPYATDIVKHNTIRYTPAQVEAIISGSNPGLTLIVGPPGTGKTDVVTQIINNIYHNFPDERTLLITHSNHALNKLFEKIIDLDIDVQHLIRLGHGEDALQSDSSFSDVGRVDHLMRLRTTLLERVTRLAASINAPGAHGSSCETAVYFKLVYIDPAEKKFLKSCDDNLFESPESVSNGFPFKDYFSDAPTPLFEGASTAQDAISKAKAGLRHINRLFKQLGSIQPLEILKFPKERSNYILLKQARIIALTSTHAAIRRRELIQMGFHYDNLIIEEAAQLTETDSVIPMTLQSPSDNNNPLKRVVLVGDHHQNSPIVQNYAFRQYSNLQQSLFERLIRIGVPTSYLDAQGRSRPEIAAIYSGRYKKLENLPQVLQNPEFVHANPGFLYTFQFINVDDYQGQGESSPVPHFIQNLGEAEYAVAIFQYMRLLGYPGEKITILAAYMGQKALIQNILQDRCVHNPFFGSPGSVSTIDQYQGQQNDYVIVSFVRTLRLGYLRDIRRLTVALSRARLGLYVLGRRSIIENCFEIHNLVNKLIDDRSDKLTLVTHEMFGVPPRLAAVDSNEKSDKNFVMENVEHLGQYVYEMTLQKAQAEKNRVG